jgi:hypothetical protein
MSTQESSALGGEIGLEMGQLRAENLPQDEGVPTAPDHVSPAPEMPPEPALLSRFKGRHIQMIGLGKSIC